MTITFDDLYPGRFLKAGNIPNGKANYTIKAVVRDQVEGEKGMEDKVVMSFEETAMQLVLPKVNAVAIRAMFGGDVQQWIGKRVTLFTTTEIMPYPARRNEPCIRVFGSPDIMEEVVCEWTPPKRRKLTQKLQPTGYYQVALRAIKQATPDQVDKLRQRVIQLAESGELSDAEQSTLLSKINDLQG
jgi:hypothetical protein